MTNLREKKYFYFTQNSMKTFSDCPFKFKKKYIDNIKWEVGKDISSKADFGNNFHKIAERYFLGVPIIEEDLDEELYQAYINLKEAFPIVEENTYLPEYTIRFVDNDIRLESNIDLVIIKPNNHIEIWDWKTNSNLEKAKNYNTSMQTQVYLYSIKKIAKDILGLDVDYENISMTYFNPENKLELAKVVYSKKLDELYYQNISNLIEKIYNYNYQNFDRNQYIKNCKFCEFNLFCSNIKEKDVEFSQEIDFDTIDEFM